MPSLWPGPPEAIPALFVWQASCDTVIASVRLWPKIDLALHKIMKEVVEPKIQDKVPFALKGLTFTKFTLGKTRRGQENATPSEAGSGAEPLGKGSEVL